MRLAICAVPLVLAVTSAAHADALKKAYFGATRPGSSARYEMTATGGMRASYTYTRLPDRDGRVVIDLKAEYLEGAGSGSSSTSRYVLKKEMDFARDAMSYLQWLEVMEFVDDKGGGTALPAETVAAIHKSSHDYANGFTFKAADKAEGRACDRYAYRGQSKGPAPTSEEGELCLDPSVPFGIVRQSGVVKDKAGKVQSEFTLRLLGSDAGSGAGVPEVEAKGKAAASASPAAAAKAGPLTLRDALSGEKVRIAVEVVAGSGGKKLRLTLENKTDDPLRVLVPKGKTSLEVASPIDTLVLVSPAEQTVVVPGGGKAAPLELGQAAGSGVVEGKFNLSVYEGTALFDGSVTSGEVK